MGVAQVCQRNSHFWVLLTVVAFFYAQRPFQVVALLVHIAEIPIGVAQVCQRASHFWVLLTVVSFYAQRPFQVVALLVHIAE
eukprot:1309268-Amphidinium_carterae.1